MRVVIDTNIIVSAYLGGELETILHLLLNDKFKLIVSKKITDEYFSVLSRPKFKIKLEELNDFAALLIIKAETVTPTQIGKVEIADPSDPMFLDAALEGNADYIVSGDHHLLEMKVFQDIPVITGRQFINIFQ